MKRERGFSLIELVVVMVIAAILVALAMPRLSNNEIQAAWFYEQVKAAVRYAQRQAVAQRRCVFVTVTAVQVNLAYGNAGCTSAATPLKQITTGADYQLNAPTGVAMDPTVFSFNGLGQPSGALLTFNVAGKAIPVTPETGYVR